MNVFVFPVCDLFLFHLFFLDEAQVAEAKLYLRSIYDWWEASNFNQTMNFARLCLAMAFLSFILDEALEVSSVGMDLSFILFETISRLSVNEVIG